MGALVFFKWANTGKNKTQTQVGYGRDRAGRWIKRTRQAGGPAQDERISENKVPSTIRDEADLEPVFTR